METIIGVHQCRSTKFMPVVAWLIMIFQGMNPFNKSAWNHIACSYIDEAGGLRFFDATGYYGFEERSSHTFAKTNHIIRSTYIEIPNKRVDLIRWVNENEPKVYDKSDVVGDTFRLLGFKSHDKHGHGYNYKKLTCNKVPLLLLKDFRGIYNGDPDLEDLLTTWKIVKRYRVNGSS